MFGKAERLGMETIQPVAASASPPAQSAINQPASEANPANPRGGVTADARNVTPLQFMDAMGMSSPEKRAARLIENQERCIRAIVRGDTYGIPPLLVEECRAIMAERERLGIAVETELRFTMDMQANRKSA